VQFQWTFQVDRKGPQHSCSTNTVSLCEISYSVFVCHCFRVLSEVQHSVLLCPYIFRPRSCDTSNDYVAMVLNTVSPLQWHQHMSQNNMKKCHIVVPCVGSYSKYLARPILRYLVVGKIVACSNVIEVHWCLNNHQEPE
jgi:hypothetical protein